MKDLTIIMLTPNLVPTNWASFHKEKLLEAADGSEIITISSKPLDWGINLIQTEYGYSNIYKQVLIGAERASTKYIAIADDDTLYPAEHYQYRPPDDVFMFNLNRWHMLTWGEPIYFHKPKPGNGCMICNRDILIKTLRKRFENRKKLPKDLCHELGTVKTESYSDEYKWKSFYTTEPIMSFYHDFSVEEATRKHKKRIYPVRAYDIPKWGRAEELLKKFS